MMEIPILNQHIEKLHTPGPISLGKKEELRYALADLVLRDYAYEDSINGVQGQIETLKSELVVGDKVSHDDTYDEIDRLEARRQSWTNQSLARRISQTQEAIAEEMRMSSRRASQTHEAIHEELKGPSRRLPQTQEAIPEELKMPGRLIERRCSCTGMSTSNEYADKQFSRESWSPRRASVIPLAITGQPRMPKLDEVVDDRVLCDSCKGPVEVDIKQGRRESVSQKLHERRASISHEANVEESKLLKSEANIDDRSAWNAYDTSDDIDLKPARRPSYSENLPTRRFSKAPEAIYEEPQTEGGRDARNSYDDHDAADEIDIRQSRRDNWVKQQQPVRRVSISQEAIDRDMNLQKQEGVRSECICGADDTYDDMDNKQARRASMSRRKSLRKNSITHEAIGRKSSLTHEAISRKNSITHEAIAEEPSDNTNKRQARRDSLSKKSKNKKVSKKQMINEWASEASAWNAMEKHNDESHYAALFPVGPTYENKGTQWDLEDCWDRPLIFQESVSTLTEEFLAAAAHIRLHLDDLMPDDSHILRDIVEEAQEEMDQVSRKKNTDLFHT